MVGVQLNEAGNEIIAFEILACCRGAGADICNQPITEQDRAGNDIVFKHDAGIGKNLFGTHCGCLSIGWQASARNEL
ncbi:hypothetical protein D3C80_1751540 [compost metagenome]